MKSIRRLFGTLCFLLGLVALVWGLGEVTRDKIDAGRLHSFYEQPNGTIDIIFTGSSHAMCAIDPSILWEDFGISAYVYASSALPPAPVYYQTAEALRVQSPSVVALDVSGAMYDLRTTGPEFLHIQLDNMEWSINKVRAIHDLIEDPADRWEYYFPIIRFHSRWKDLTYEDFTPARDDARGARIRDRILEGSEIPETVPCGYTSPIPAESENYIRKTIELCQSAGVDILLFNTPDLANDLFQGRRNAVAALAEEYGVPYLNLMYHLDEMGFDWDTDLFDEGHCNRTGAEKVTGFIGRYLTDNMEI